MVNFLKFGHSQINYLVINAGIHKMLVGIANREDPDQAASPDLGLGCLSMPFGSHLVFII